MYNNFVTFLGVKKTTITLFSISTIFAVLIIATAILLIGNYTKNLNSGINLEPQTLQSDIYLVNNTDTDMTWVLSDLGDIDKNLFQDLDTTILTDQIVLGILGQAQPNANYSLKLDTVRLRGQRINISYQILTDDTSQISADVITYPKELFTVSKNKLPVGVPLEFVFYNQTTKTEVIINKTITL